MKRKRSVGLVGACLLEINCARRTWSRTTRAEVGSRERVGVSSPVGRGEGNRMKKGGRMVVVRADVSRHKCGKEVLGLLMARPRAS